jgi:O-acetylserine/cysteine efflux transporter
MKRSHVALAIAVAAVWGFNFVVIDVGLGEFPPLLFSALRFVLCVIPAIFFVGRPQVAWKWIIAVGLLLGVFMFGLMFLGIYAGMPAGLTSLVMQSQVVFTVLIAFVLLGERPARGKLIGMGVAMAGIILIAVDFGMSSPLLAFITVIGAAIFWSMSNIAQRMAKPPDILNFMVWVSVIPPIPLIAISIPVEGWQRDLDALASMNLTGIGATVYVAYISTLFGFGAWGWLLRNHTASAVAPYSLLVPVFGISGAALLLNEHVSAAEIAGGLLIIIGVAATALPGRRPPPVPTLAVEPTGAPVKK